MSYYKGGFIPKKVRGPYPEFKMLDYGSLIYPDIVFSFKKDNQTFYVDHCYLKSYNMSCGTYNCYIQEEPEGTSLSLLSSSFRGYHTEFINSEALEPYFTHIYFHKKGYIRTSVPPTRYKLICNFAGPAVGEFAYADFVVEPNEEVVITPSMFVKGENIEEKVFNKFIEKLEIECGEGS